MIHHDQLTPQEAQEIIASLIAQRDAAIEHLERLLSGGQGWPWHEKDAEDAGAFVAAVRSLVPDEQASNPDNNYDRSS